MEFKWEDIKAVLTILVDYFKKVFTFFGYIPEDAE